MIVQKQADLDPAMKSALKNHIMRKRQQLKQELEQDAIEKRLKREQEAKRKQDAMTLDQLKEQLIQLEKTLDNLKNEKHSLFAQLKQNMRVLNEDDTRRKQKEGEIRQQQQQQQQHQHQHQQQQQQQQNSSTLDQPLAVPANRNPQQAQTASPAAPINGVSETSVLSVPTVQENNLPAHRDSSKAQEPNAQILYLQQQQPPPSHHHLHHHHQQAQQQPQEPRPLPPPSSSHSTQSLTNTQPQPIQANHHEHDTIMSNQNSHQSHHPPSHIQQQQRNSSIFNPAAFSHLLNAHNAIPRHSPYLAHLPPNRTPNPYGHMSPYPPPLGHHPPSLISGHGIPTSLSHVPQTSPMIRPSPPPMSSAGTINSGLSKLPPLSLPITSSGPQAPVDFNPNLATSTAHQIQQQAMNDSAAAAAAVALGLPYGPPYFSSNSPIGPPLTSQQALEHHAALNAAAAAAVNHSHLNRTSGNSNCNTNASNNNSVNNASSNSSRANQLPPMKRPISSTILANDALSPSKKLHTQPPTPNPPHQLPPSLSSPYLGYPGLPPSLGSSGGPSLPASLFGTSLMRTPPPPNINSLFNSAAFSHLLNAHNFPRQSSYLTHLPQNRTPNPYGSMNPYPPLNQHIPSLITGHGIPTSLSHVQQTASLIRPSPPPMSNSGPPKMPPLSLPISSSGPPTPMDFNPNLVSSTAHQMQQQALNNSAAARAAAAAAALGITGYGTSYFNSNSPIGPPSQF